MENIYKLNKKEKTSSMRKKQWLHTTIIFKHFSSLNQLKRFQLNRMFSIQLFNQFFLFYLILTEWYAKILNDIALINIKCHFFSENKINICYKTSLIDFSWKIKLAETELRSKGFFLAGIPSYQIHLQINGILFLETIKTAV